MVGPLVALFEQLPEQGRTLLGDMGEVLSAPEVVRIQKGAGLVQEGPPDRGFSRNHALVFRRKGHTWHLTHQTAHIQGRPAVDTAPFGPLGCDGQLVVVRFTVSLNPCPDRGLALPSLHQGQGGGYAVAGPG